MGRNRNGRFARLVSARQPLQRSLLVEEVEEIALVRLVPGNLIGGYGAEIEALDMGRGEELVS